jgi:hypothetical protein
MARIPARRDERGASAPIAARPPDQRIAGQVVMQGLPRQGWGSAGAMGDGGDVAVGGQRYGRGWLAARTGRHNKRL